MRTIFLVLASLLLFAACSSPALVPTVTRAAVVPTATTTPTVTPTSAPTVTPTPTNTATPTLTPTPHPILLANTVEGLRARDYRGGEIKITHWVTDTGAYVGYLITYPSDNLTISGLMYVPKGDGPFPVIILNHGYLPPSQYWSGSDTFQAADYYARRGFLTLSPDFRGYARSDTGLNIYRMGYVMDALNLAASVKSLPYADAQRIGIWGHSMGGGVTTGAIVVNDLVKAAVLYAPVSADKRVGTFAGGLGGTSSSIPSDLYDSYYYWAYRGDMVDEFSPINYFAYVRAPVQIHIGTADTTTPPRWSQAIRDALKKNSKTVEYYEYPYQGHAFFGASWELFNQRVVQFFDKYLR